MEYHELEDGTYLCNNGKSVQVIKISTSKTLIDMGYPLKIAKSITVIGRGGAPSEMRSCEFKRVDLNDLWEFV